LGVTNLHIHRHWAGLRRAAAAPGPVGGPEPGEQSRRSAPQATKSAMDVEFV
jgi:hypothetical protein